ncbi:hypothetical protein HY68_12775 [Streptomyces sp. AcH 505]|uniref:hypothetical protein n=1 Tax=Streptomyces sp. AcH 505 TaxID=352211 RepID=UPI0005922239|nr:hypothetical protein HY68_12775 [Streptomyces sp. AcH 505]
MKNTDVRVWLRRVSLAAGIAFTATAEYDLARQLGANGIIAAMLPVALDAYAMAALRWFRAFDVALSLALMGAAQVAAHLLDANVMTVNIPMVVVVSLLVPVAIWRTHALARTEHAEPAAPESVAVSNGISDVSMERVPESYPEIEAAVPDAPVEESQPRPVFAAEGTRTRPEVHAVLEGDEDPLTPMSIDNAADHFSGQLGDGILPTIRDIKTKLRVGQKRAQELQEEFRKTLVTS